MIELKQLQKVVDGRTLIDIDALTVAAGEIAAIAVLPFVHVSTSMVSISWPAIVRQLRLKALTSIEPEQEGRSQEDAQGKDDYAQLTEHFYIPPDSVFQRVKVEEFVGREWLDAKNARKPNCCRSKEQPGDLHRATYLLA